MSTHISFITSVFGLVTAAILAFINSWVGTRAGVDENLRTQRLGCYPALWSATGTIPRWPRAEVTRGSVLTLHETLRSWYYTAGGLFLSEPARARYGEVQELIEAILTHPSDPESRLDDDTYTRLMDAASILRWALTEDLNTRRRESLIEKWRRTRRHAAAARDAQTRIDYATRHTTCFSAKSG
jgi:hypothetical protein